MAGVPRAAGLKDRPGGTVKAVMQTLGLGGGGAEGRPVLYLQ